MRLCQFSNYFTKNSSSFFPKIWKTYERSDCNRKVIPNLRTLVKNCEFFQISPAIMHAIIIDCSGAIAMNLTVEKQWGQQVVIIAEHVSLAVSNVLI